MILIDPPAWPFRGRLFSHVASDGSIEELHGFARRVGLHPRSYDGDHYDVPAERYDDVVVAGARPVSNRQLLAAIQAAGLRFRKRRGERPVASLADALPFVRVPHRLELLCSPAEPPEAATVATVVFVADARGRVLLVEHRSGSGWEAPGGWREPGETVREAAVREVAEETGVRLDGAALTPFGYQRIRCEVAPDHLRLLRVSHVAVLTALHGATGVDGMGRKGRSIVWETREGVRRRCGDAPWWPLLERYTEDSLASSTAMLSRARDSQGLASGRA